MEIKKIVVPLDGSALAETSIPAAVQIAKDQRATVVLVQAVEAHWLAGEPITDAQVRVVRDAEEYLGMTANRVRADGITVQTSVWYGAPAVSIIDAAKAQGAGLIVMTSHGRSGLSRLILGSVAEAVLRGTTTPILLLRDAGAPVTTPDGNARRVEAAHA